jgi:hypothetical protein
MHLNIDVTLCLIYKHMGNVLTDNVEIPQYQIR